MRSEANVRRRGKLELTVMFHGRFALYQIYFVLKYDNILCGIVRRFWPTATSPKPSLGV